MSINPESRLKKIARDSGYDFHKSAQSGELGELRRLHAHAHGNEHPGCRAEISAFSAGRGERTATPSRDREIEVMTNDYSRRRATTLLSLMIDRMDGVLRDAGRDDLAEGLMLLEAIMACNPDLVYVSRRDFRQVLELDDSALSLAEAIYRQQTFLSTPTVTGVVQ